MSSSDLPTLLSVGASSLTLWAAVSVWRQSAVIRLHEVVAGAAGRPLHSRVLQHAVPHILRDHLHGDLVQLHALQTKLSRLSWEESLLAVRLSQLCTSCL